MKISNIFPWTLNNELKNKLGSVTQICTDERSLQSLDEELMEG